ncbi:MAG: alpha/beta hydrolase [Candidatus Competibacteraceae bacterium]
MAYEPVTRPLTSREAFQETSDTAALSQAAVLLLLGNQLRGDAQLLQARAATAARGAVAGPLPEEDQAELEVPQLRLTGERFSLQQVQSGLQQHGLKVRMTLAATPKEPVAADTLAAIADRLHQSPEPATAAELMEASLQSPQELTRVAAASSYIELSTEPVRPLKVLERGTQSTDSLVREVAATALTRHYPESPALRKLTRKTRPSTGGKPSHTSLIVHGTFARNESWWQPGGDFHSYLRQNVRPDLYSAGDRFEWSGAYSDGARAIAATDLRAWVNKHNLNGLDLFAHSHGGNIAMLASQGGLSIGTLVLLSCPVHVDKYFPAFDRVRKVVSIRVKVDLVILADGGGQRFSDPRIQENVLPLWFNHSATHDPKVWRKYNVPAML